MADVTVEAGLEASHYLAGKRTGIIWTSDTVGYAFFITSTANAAGPFKYSKTTDGGQTWGADVTIDASNSSRFAVWYDKETNGDTGTKIHTANFNWDDNHLWYRNLDTASDTLGTAVDVGTIVAAGDMHLDYIQTGYLSIAKARGGNLGILCFSGSGTGGPYFYRSTDGGGTWGSRSNAWHEGDDEDHGQLIPAGDSDTNDFACIYMDESANELSFKLHDDSANTWGTETSIGSLMTTDWPDAYWGFDVAVRHSDDKAIIAWWTDENTATADLNVSVLTLTAAGANATALTAIATNLSAAGEVCVMINGNNDDIYVAWIAGGTWDSLTDIDHTVSTDDGSTWAGTTQFSETQDDLRNVHCMSIIASGQSGRWMPVWENDDLLDLVTNYANSVAITTGGGSNYNQSAAGTMGTLSATLVLKTGKTLSGISGSYSATLVRLTGKALAGTSGSSSAELAKSTTKSFAGTMGDLSATLSAIKTALVAVSGAVGDLTGSIARQVNKALVGVSGSVSGTLVKLTSKAFSGADGGLSGALNASAGKFVELAGVAGDLAGTLAKQTLKSLSGATDTVSGAISKQINKALSGASGSVSGTLSSSVYKVVELAGAAGNLTGTLTRSIAKSLAGTASSVSGSIAKAISKSFSGTMGALSGSFTTFAPTEYLQSITGSISSITGSVTMAMVFRRAKMKAGYAIRSIINGGRRLTD